MRKHIFASLLEAVFIAGGVIVEHFTNITPVWVATAVIIISLLGMVALYYREIAGWFRTKIDPPEIPDHVKEEFKNALGAVAIVFYFLLVMVVIIVWIRIAMKIPIPL